MALELSPDDRRNERQDTLNYGRAANILKDENASERDKNDARDYQDAYMARYGR